MNRIWRIPRSRGVLSGALLILLGAWGALVAFIGPTFRFAYTPDSAWTYTSGRLWLEILPGAAALLAGIVVLASTFRPVVQFGSWLAALGGAWFVVGNLIGPAWFGGNVSPGTPVGAATTRALEQIGFFTGLGAAIVFVAAFALGRASVIGARDGGRVRGRPHGGLARRLRLVPNRRNRPNRRGESAQADRVTEDAASRV